ncbi:hypothetical protein OKW28_003225 [Paraburkholderia sp. 40]
MPQERVPAHRNAVRLRERDDPVGRFEVVLASATPIVPGFILFSAVRLENWAATSAASAGLSIESGSIAAPTLKCAAITLRNDGSASAGAAASGWPS